jgi:hypothetical protein
LTRPQSAITFKPTGYAGAFATIGFGAVDITGSATINNNGIMTAKITGGGLGVLRF